MKNPSSEEKSMGDERKTAIVTGGGRGIGRAIALDLAKEGVRVAVLDILAENAEAVKNEIEAAGGEAIAIRTDLTQCRDVQSAVDQTVARFGKVDVLVNNAGWDKLEPFLESEEGTWDKVIAINFKAILYTCRAVLPHMVAQGSGRVINIASDA